MPKRNKAGTVTVTNAPDLWRVREIMGVIAGEMYGYRCTTKSVRYRETGEEVPRSTTTAMGLRYPHADTNAAEG